MNHIRRNERRLHERGTSTIEAALIGGLAAAVIAVSIDIVSYLQARMALDQVSGGVANSVAQYDSLAPADFTALFATAKQMAGDLVVEGVTGGTIITGICNSGGTPKIVWQQITPGSSVTSSFGVKNATPSGLPDNYTVSKGTALITVEVITQVKPWVLGEKVMGSTLQALRSATLYQPRLSALPSTATEKCT